MKRDKKELATWIRGLIQENKLYQFYKSKEWIELREKILRQNHYECEWCREKGKIRKAEEVHHVQYVRKHPESALDEYYTFNGVQRKNLLALCHDCHDKAHGRMGHQERKQFNEERW